MEKDLKEPAANAALKKNQIKALKELGEPGHFRVNWRPNLSPDAYRDLVDRGLVQEAWTWASVTRPDVSITDAGVTALKATSGSSLETEEFGVAFGQAALNAMAEVRDASRLMAEGGLVGAATPSASLEEVLAILAHAEVLRARGSNDVPAFDLCVNAEKIRLRSILQANEVKRLSNPVDDGAVERDKLRAELAAQDNFILTFTNVSRNGDWACAQCKPHSGTIKAGFVCGYHRAEARAASKQRSPTHDREYPGS